MQQEQRKKGAGGLGYRELALFFLPLAVTPFLIASTHTMINAALARLPFPELSIAVFSVVKSFTNAIKAPDSMFNQLSVSLIGGRQSFKLTMKFIWIVCGLFFAVLFLLGYTPLGELFLRRVMGLTDERAIDFAYMAMRITCFLPIVETLRNAHQGIAIGRERTELVSAGSVLRVLVIVFFLLVVVRAGNIPGIVAASLVWTGGIGIEGLLVVGSIFYYFRSPLHASEGMPGKGEGSLRLADILKFFVPLAVMMLLQTSLQPLIQSGLARSPHEPTRALAAYGVAWGLVLVIAGPLRMMHHCSLVYVDSGDVSKWKTVQRFTLLVGTAISLVLLFMGLTPLGYIFMRRAIAVSEPVARMANSVLIAFSVFPLLRAWREAYWGLLMRQRNTNYIGAGKLLNLLTVLTVLFLAFGPLAGLFGLPAAVLGALAFTVGEVVESIIIWRYAVGNVEPVKGTTTSVQGR